MIGIARRRTGTNGEELLSAELLDILYADANGNLFVDSRVLPASEYKIPIGICVASTGFFGDNEPARFMSLKYMNYTTPETGALSAQGICWGNYGTDIPTIDNITVTYNGGSSNGYFTAGWITNTSNKIPSLFDANDRWNTSVLGTVNQYVVTDIDGKNKTDKILAIATSQSNWRTAGSITNNTGAGYAPAACCCARYHTFSTQAGDWYLGAGGEMSLVVELRNQINTKLAQLYAIYPNYCISSMGTSVHLSSTEYDNNNAYGVNLNNGRLNYFKKNSTYNIVAMIQPNKKSGMTSNYPYVDLGLPSGLLWAKGNIIKDTQGNYSMGSETDYGCYFSWGNIDGHNAGDGYNWSYSSTSGSKASTDIDKNINYDAACACLGYPWQMPTSSDFQELLDYTDREWTTIDGVNGWKFMKKTDHSVYIFLPANGVSLSSGTIEVNQKGRYWSSKWHSKDYAGYLYFTNSQLSVGNNTRVDGYAIRAVRSA